MGHRRAERSCHTPKGRGGGREEQPHLQGVAAAGHGSAERTYSTFKVRRGGREKIPLVQGKRQRLRCREEIGHVRGKRNSGKTVGVARGHQRADTLKPQSQKTSQSDPRTTAVSNSVKLSHAVGATQDSRVMGRGLTE